MPAVLVSAAASSCRRMAAAARQGIISEPLPKTCDEKE